MSKRTARPYFAQNGTFGPKGHQSKHFKTAQEAVEFLRERGGGTIKRRDSERFYHLVAKVRPDGTTRDRDNRPVVL